MINDRTQELFEMIAALRDGETLTLKRGERYDIWQDSCTVLKDYYASNTVTRDENPMGMHRVALFLRNRRNIVIDGNGATLMIHGVITPLLVDCCEGVTIKNLTIDYARPTMNEYRIESCEDGVSILQMHQDCLYEVTDGTLFFCGERDRNGNLFWRMPTKGAEILSMYCNRSTEQVRFFGREEGDRFPSIPTIERAEDLGGGRVRVVWRNQNASLPVGCTVQTRSVRRDELGGLFQYSKNLRLENLRIAFMHGFGLLCQYCENVTYRALDCTPSRGRTIACNADFFHFSGCSGHIRIERCTAAGAHDDFVNVHGTHLRVVKTDGRQLRVRFENPNTWGLRAFSEGDRIDLIRWDTMLPYAARRVRKVERIDETDFLLTLDRKLPKTVRVGRDVVENATCTPRLTVKNNSFGPSMGRGILCTTRKRIRIVNNLFYKVGGSVLYVASDCNFWMESGYTTDLLFRANILVDCAYGPGKKPCPPIYVKAEVTVGEGIPPAVHRHVRLLGNVIVGEEDTPWKNEYAYVGRITDRNNQFQKEERADQ